MGLGCRQDRFQDLRGSGGGVWPSATSKIVRGENSIPCLADPRAPGVVAAHSDLTNRTLASEECILQTMCQSDLKNATSTFFSSSDNLSYAVRLLAASATCSSIASCSVEALPSCRKRARSRTPHQGGVRISSGRALPWAMPSPVPTSCRRKSLYGKNRFELSGLLASKRMKTILCLVTPR